MTTDTEDGLLDSYLRWRSTDAPAKLRLQVIDMKTLGVRMVEIDIPTLDAEQVDALMPLVRDAFERALRYDGPYDD